jgi:hypothetical protein
MLITSDYDQAQGPHDGPPVSLIVPIVPAGGHPTFTAPLITSAYVGLGVPRAPRSTFGHDGERWEVTGRLPWERGGAGESKDAPSTRSATVDSSVCGKPSCIDRVPDSSSVTTHVTQPVSDVPCGNATREQAVTDVHGDNDDDEGGSDRTEGDYRVTVTEAAVFAWCEKSPAQPSMGSQVPKFVPLGKGVETLETRLLGKGVVYDLTEFDIGVATKPQPRLGDP